MESKYNFRELMKERHSCRKFQSKPIPEATLKDIISISLMAPSWCNSQPWNIYVASGKTMEEIRKEWIAKGKEKVKGYADVNPGHRTDFSERSQATMGNSLNHGKNCQTKTKLKNQIHLYLMLLLWYILHLIKGIFHILS